MEEVDEMLRFKEMPARSTDKTPWLSLSVSSVSLSISPSLSQTRGGVGGILYRISRGSSDVSRERSYVTSHVPQASGTKGQQGIGGASQVGPL